MRRWIRKRARRPASRTVSSASRWESRRSRICARTSRGRSRARRVCSPLASSAGPLQAADHGVPDLARRERAHVGECDVGGARAVGERAGYRALERRGLGTEMQRGSQQHGGAPYTDALPISDAREKAGLTDGLIRLSVEVEALE